MVRAPLLCVIVTALFTAGATAQSPGNPAAGASGQATASPERARVTHLLQRATWGVRAADVDAVLSMGAEAWLDRQLAPGRIRDRAVEERLKQFPAAHRDMSEAIVQFQRFRRERQQVVGGDSMRGRQRPPTRSDSTRARARSDSMPVRRAGAGATSPQLLLLDLSSARVARAVYTERQLEDVMTDFWYNHFNVFFGKGLDRFMVADYEARAIRPHVFGRFRDMLEATAKHPAMLFYLDNATSVAANTAGAGGRSRGLNENYARELLELHTLGVDGGYTQQDIINVARAFTGWSFSRPGLRGNNRVEFQFRLALHDRGEKIVLGKRLTGGRGVEDGEDVLDLLARHPATARHISRKLVERFVSDSPDPAFVDELAAVFTKTDGDLRAVTRALFTSERFYAAEVQRAKIKTPFELVVSALRVTDADVGRSRGTVQTLRMLGQLPYNAADPTGYPSASDDWVNSGAMVNRMNLALALAAGRLDNVRVDPRVAESVMKGDTAEFLTALLAQLIPGADTGALQRTILRELANAEPENGQRSRLAGRSPLRQNTARAIGLALGSPEFQRK